MRCTTLTDAEPEPHNRYDARLCARKLWFAILSLARNDDAISLQLNPALGDNCLICATPREEFSVVPPPEHIRDYWVAVGCEIITGGSFLGKLRRIASRVCKSSISGSVTVQETGRVHTWIGTYTHPSITFRRI